MSFCYIGSVKECISPANEFVLHTERRTSIYSSLDKRYSPIISTICEPNSDNIYCHIRHLTEFYT